MTSPKEESKFVAIPQELYEEFRAKERPSWAKRHRESLFVSVGTTILVAIGAIILDYRTASRFESMDHRIQSVQTQTEGLSGQVKLIGDRLQSIDTRAQSIDDRLIEVQVKVGTIEGRIGERLGSTEHPPVGAVPTAMTATTVETPTFNQTNSVPPGIHQRVGNVSDTPHQKELAH